MGLHHGQANFVTYGKPSLFLDFANKKSLVDRISGNNLITFTRSSIGSYVGADGLIKYAAADEPRFDHDPETGESLGLLIEEQRTNLVNRSTATGATIGVLGSGGELPTGWGIDQVQPGTNLEIVNFGTEKGLNYIDLRFYGTTTGTNRWLVRPGSAFNITNGVTYSVSCYAKLISGSTAGNYLNYVGASLIGVNSNSNLTRYTRTFTATSTGTLYHRLDVGVNSIGTTYDLTIRFAAPQLEQGSFPTSYIPTSSSTLTRNADNLTITNANYPFPCTIFGEYNTYVNQYARRFFEIIPPSASGNTSIRPLINTNGVISAFSTYTNASVAQTTNSITPYTPFKFTFGIGRTGTSYTTDKLVLDGGDIAESTTSTLPDTYFTNILFGNSTIGDDPRRWCGHINRFVLYDNYLNNSQLQSLTQ